MQSNLQLFVYFLALRTVQTNDTIIQYLLIWQQPCGQSDTYNILEDC